MTRFAAPCHAPQGTVLHAVVQGYFEAWLINRRSTGRLVPSYVERAFRMFLDCGHPSSYRTLACPKGHFTRFLAERCKGRAFCAYCLTIRQRELGRRLIDRVIGNVPCRHVVQCFPPHLRYIIVYDESLFTGAFTSLWAGVFAYQRRKAAELFLVPVECIHPALVVVNHRVSANLDTNHHLHGIFPDGVFIELPGGRIEFRRLPAPTPEDVAGIAHDACLAFCEVLKSRGFWTTTSVSPSGVEGVLTLPGRRSRLAKFFGEAAKHAEGGVAPIGGAYAFHAFVGDAIELEERPRLDQLVNYILAPSLTDNQVTVTASGDVGFRFKRERHDGLMDKTFRPFEFLDRLADLVPRRNTNTVRYFGIYAPRARFRRRAVALRLPGSQPLPPRRARAMMCPLCSANLVVVAVVRVRRGTDEGIPPDTPRTVIPRGQDRIGRTTSDQGQGRLFG